MIGNNELILNEATMIQAVQEWLDRKMPDGTPKVTGVKVAQGKYTADTFTVSLTDAVNVPEKDPA